MALLLCVGKGRKQGSFEGLGLKDFSFCVRLTLQYLLEDNKAKNLYLIKGPSSPSAAYFSMFCQAEMNS